MSQHAEDAADIRYAADVIDEYDTKGRRRRFTDALRRIADRVEDSAPPTGPVRFCNQGGCRYSWHVGGNYGSHVCRNPDHHDPKDDTP